MSKIPSIPSGKFFPAGARAVPPVQLHQRAGVAFQYILDRLRSSAVLRPLVGEIGTELPPIDFRTIATRLPVVNIFPTDSPMSIQGSGRAGSQNIGGNMLIQVWIIAGANNVKDSINIWDAISGEMCGDNYYSRLPELWDRGISGISVYQPAYNPVRFDPDLPISVATGILKVIL